MSHQLLLIVPPFSSFQASLNSALGGELGHRCETVHWGSNLPGLLSKITAQLIIAVAIPFVDEISQSFQWLEHHPIPTPILVILPDGLDEENFRPVLKVADDFMLAPVRLEELRVRLTRLLATDGDRIETAHEHLLEELGLRQLVGKAPVFAEVIRLIPLIAKSGIPLLISGETGTGKEQCARAIHHLGKRRDFPFVPVDCGAVPDHLFENELFGHVRGAYTDAHSDQRGLIALASGGTLFLDEIDALSLTAQAKLLRFLQEGTYRPLGSERFTRSDVNIIAATNRDVEDSVRKKQMRADLYFRLNVMRLKLPPLRERQGDIELLANHFLKLQAAASGLLPRKLAPAALRKLWVYDWPGNVRELFNVVQRAALFADGQYILPDHISLPLSEPIDEIEGEDFRGARARVVEAFEKRYVEHLLSKHNGNVTHAASEAGKDRRSFGRLKKKYRIET